jgi:hypothetical protein
MPIRRRHRDRLKAGQTRGHPASAAGATPYPQRDRTADMLSHIMQTSPPSQGVRTRDSSSRFDENIGAWGCVAWPAILARLSLLAIPACSGSSAGIDDARSTAVGSSLSNTASASSPAVRPVLDLGNWRLVRSWTRDQKDSFGVYGGRLVLLQAPPAGGAAYSSVQRQQGGAVLRHIAGPGQWLTQGVGCGVTARCSWTSTIQSAWFG